LYEIALGTAVFVGLLIADRLMGKEKRPRGAMISWFFALYFTGRLFTENYKEIEALDPHSAISMGQYLSVLPALLGWYGLYWAFKHKEPVGWVDTSLPPDEHDTEEEEDDDASDKANASDDSEEEEDEDGEDEDGEDESIPATKKAAVDPDVEAEFEAGKLKKRRNDEPEA
jgi:hypothetical protein